MIGLLALLSGCSSELSFSEVREDSVNINIQSFLQDVQESEWSTSVF